jgi:hypothetical protein
MDRTCDTCGVQEKCIKGFGGEAGQLEGLVVDRKIILQWICKKYDGGLDWIDLAHH